jgi:hypothetical protein
VISDVSAVPFGSKWQGLGGRRILQARLIKLLGSGEWPLPEQQKKKRRQAGALANLPFLPHSNSHPNSSSLLTIIHPARQQSATVFAFFIREQYSPFSSETTTRLNPKGPPAPP